MSTSREYTTHPNPFPIARTRGGNGLVFMESTRQLGNAFGMVGRAGLAVESPASAWLLLLSVSRAIASGWGARDPWRRHNKQDARIAARKPAAMPAQQARDRNVAGIYLAAVPTDAVSSEPLWYTIVACTFDLGRNSQVR